MLHFGAISDGDDDDDDDGYLPPSAARFFRRFEAPDKSAASSADFVTGLMLQMVTAGKTSCGSRCTLMLTSIG